MTSHHDDDGEMKMAADDCSMNQNLARWETRWANNQLRWHKDEISPALLKYGHLLLNSDTSKNKKRILVPLCGKSKDLLYLAENGGEVVGIEGIPKAIHEFIQENGLHSEYDSTNSTHELQSSTNYKLKIFQGDFFTASVEKWGSFDSVFDYNALTAVHYEQREAYVQKIRESVSRSYMFSILIRTVSYDREKKLNDAGPRSVSEQDMQNLFASWTQVKLLETNPLPKDSIICKTSLPGSKCDENIYLLTKK